MTRQEFIDKWKRHVAGVIALGHAEARPLLQGKIEGAVQVGSVMFTLQDETVKLLGQLFDSLHREEKRELAKPLNGKHP